MLGPPSTPHTGPTVLASPGFSRILGVQKGKGISHHYYHSSLSLNMLRFTLLISDVFRESGTPKNKG